ncbi:MAG: hypothetical protein LBU53_12795 [Zoogloeaceae bacterium]|jgi:hypothetical protein|nr:hypothetical protein [Zoogloeaceae bacterium]
MFPGCVDYREDTLHITTYDASIVDLSAASIMQINCCQYDDPLQDEEFFILFVSEQFWLIGPFVKHALGAIYALRDKHPEIPWRKMVVHRMPWKLREPGCFGLRLFPIAGLGVFPMSDLPARTMIEG